MQRFLKKMNTATPSILLFDGVCNLCNAMVQFAIKRDPTGKIKFGALQSDKGQELLKKTGLAQKDFESFVFIQNGTHYLKSTAALKVLRELGGFWKLFYGFMVVPRPIRDFVYGLVAKSRYRIFGKRDKCMIPTPELQSRFL